MSVHLLPVPGATCKVRGPQRIAPFFWVATVDYAWTTRGPFPQNEARIVASTRRGAERRAARAITRFHAANGPSFEWSAEQLAAYEAHAKASLEALAP